MEAFIMELVDKGVTVNCGNSEIFTGVVQSCLDKVITLRKNDGGVVYINVDKIVSITPNRE